VKKSKCENTEIWKVKGKRQWTPNTSGSPGYQSQSHSLESGNSPSEGTLDTNRMWA